VHRVPAPGLPTGRRARCEAGVSVDVPRGGGAGGHPTAPAAAARLHRGYLVLAALMLVTMAAVGFGRFAYTVILPSMREGLNLTRSQMGFVATGNLTGYLGLALLGGLAASRWGSRRVILAGLAAAAAGMLLTGAAGDFAGALLGRTLTGLGSGAAYIPAASLVSAWFAAQRRGAATGVVVAGNGLGLTVSGFLLPPVLGADVDGWRTAWFALAGAAAVITLLAAVAVRDRPEDLGLTPLGGGSDESAAPAGAAAAAAGPAAGISALRWIGLAYTLWGGAYIIYVTFFAAALVEGRGLAEAAAGRLWAEAGLVSILSGILAGAASDRWGRHRALAVVLAVQAVGFAALALGTGLAWYRLSAVLYGLTAWGVPGLVAAAAGDYAGPARAAAALGVLTVGFGVGQAVGPSIGGLIIDHWGGYTPALLLAAAVNLLAAAAAGAAGGAGRARA